MSDKPTASMPTPPHDPDAERWLIGAACLSDAEKVLYECTKSHVTEATFYLPCHIEVWRLLEASYVKNGFIDIVGLSTQVRDKFDVDKAMESCNTPEHVGFYIARLKDMEKRRGIIAAMRVAAKQLYDIQSSSEEVMAEYEAASTSVLAIPNMQIKKLGDYREEKVAQWRTAKTSGFVGVPCHLFDVNAALGGWRHGCLSIIGAYRGTGKSTFIRSDAKANAKAGRHVALFSLEDPGDIASASMVCDEADVSSFDLDTGHAPASVANQADSAWLSIADLPLHLIAERCSISQIIAACTMLKKRHNIQCAYIDHIQYIYPLQLPHMNRNDTLSVYSADLSALAKRLDIGVVCTSQLNRLAEKENRPPRLSDLRDSGSLEQDARAVVLLYYSDADDCFVCEIAKNNYGKSGNKIMLWRKAGKRFEVRPATANIP